MSEISKQLPRNVALDFLKFLAAIMITNSHFQPLYKDVNVGLATLGVHGNALFFFVSGYLLTTSLDRREVKFPSWVSKRLLRIYPSVIIWGLLSVFVFSDVFSWKKVFLASDYWFVQCIIIYYPFFYFTIRYFKTVKERTLCYLLSICFSVIVFFLIEKGKLSAFHSTWHYYCHFGAMILGSVVCTKERVVKNVFCNKDILLMVVSFASYFIILKIGKGHLDWRYYTQVLGLIPLHAFCWYCYKVCTGNWCKRLMESRNLRLPFCIIASLTLEIYLVQFKVITDKFNFFFPFNTLIVFVCICAVAYILRVVVNFIMQLLNRDIWSWRKIVMLW